MPSDQSLVTSRSDSFLHLVRVLDCVLDFQVILLSYEAGRTTLQVLGYGLDYPRTVLHYMASTREFSLFQNSQTECGACPALCPLNTRSSFPRSNIFLNVHLGITLINDQIYAQFLILIRLFQSSTCFEQHRTHHQETKLY